jgi:hypothetical protein
MLQQRIGLGMVWHVGSMCMQDSICHEGQHLPWTKASAVENSITLTSKTALSDFAGLTA